MSRMNTKPPSMNHGFSLIEILVVIAIVGILIGVTFPALSHARTNARFIGSLADERSLVAAISLYADASNGYFPYHATPGHPEMGSFQDLSGFTISYFRGQSFLWPTVLATTGHDVSVIADPESLARIRESYGDQVVVTGYNLTYSCAATPQYWVGVDPPPDLSLFAGVRTAQVMYPSAKGLLVDLHASLFNEQAKYWSVGFVDGSAQKKPLDTMEVYGLPRRYGAIPWRVLTTEHGIAGIDY